MVVWPQQLQPRRNQTPATSKAQIHNTVHHRRPAYMISLLVRTIYLRTNTKQGAAPTNHVQVICKVFQFSVPRATPFTLQAFKHGVNVYDKTALLTKLLVWSEQNISNAKFYISSVMNTKKSVLRVLFPVGCLSPWLMISKFTNRAHKQVRWCSCVI